MSNIVNVSSSTTVAGSRGEIEHVRTDGYSLNFWNLRELAKGAHHSNEYDIAIYVVAGTLHVYDEADEDRVIDAGDSVLIPAGTEYSMSSESADLVEYRTNQS